MRGGGIHDLGSDYYVDKVKIHTFTHEWPQGKLWVEHLFQTPTPPVGDIWVWIQWRSTIHNRPIGLFCTRLSHRAIVYVYNREADAQTEPSYMTHALSSLSNVDQSARCLPLTHRSFSGLRTSPVTLQRAGHPRQLSFHNSKLIRILAKAPMKIAAPQLSQ